MIVLEPLRVSVDLDFNHIRHVEREKMLDDMGDDEIVGFNIPTGVPIVYELDSELRPAVPRRFLGDAAAIEAAALAVSRQAERR